MKKPLLVSILALSGCCRMQPPETGRGESVILLHGLMRNPRAMNRMAGVLQQKGYQVENVDYPSREAEIPVLAERYLTPAVERARRQNPEKIHFVGHSMGGILARYWRSTNLLPEGGDVVMLSPPNQGSEIVDRMGHWRSFQWINGPASLQLHTGDDSLPNSLPFPDYPLAVFTGSRSINPILSLMIPGTDDGKVSLERSKTEGMTTYRVFPVSHPFIMRDPKVIEATLEFLNR